MRSVIACAVVCLALVSSTASPQGPSHTLLAPAELKWGPAPAKLPPGSTIAVLSGDPSQPGPFALRAKLPAGYRVPPHWHPSAEQITIVSGTVAFGMGDTFDAAAMKELPAGGYAVMPAEMRHYVEARTAAVIEVHAMGPFVLNYVNPADDPSAPAASKPR
jgi:quercetin dioxygenase-like cupin family protein